ncbi:MAG TPA: cysteine--tRNA ligase [Planctomycetota bacterium]|nr:cysteine--tRNA ligase [Planctomycetota bacterium]
MTLRIFNTLSRKEEDFVPLEAGKVSLYTCGPTVYNRVHIGNLRAFLFYDLLRRTLEWKGQDVRHVMNITDVDDKTIAGSVREKKSLRQFTDFYLELFLKDLDALSIERPTVMPRATDKDAIDKMVELVERLEKKGAAYKAQDGSFYFKISAFPTYGKLGHLDMAGLKAGAGGRVAADEYDKENVQDFALWKAWDEKDGDVFWETRLGKGRPGWHLECSALAMRHLGETIDLHAGGVDLIFPHHENEIAQSEAATGKPFVKAWLHNEHLLIGGQKMSKRLNNFYTLGDLERLSGATPREVRFALLKVPYRMKLNFQVTYDADGKPVRFDAIEEARSSLARIDNFRRSLQERSGRAASKTAEERLARVRADFEAALDDDLNTAKAIALVFELVNDLNKEDFDQAFARKVGALLDDLDRVLAFLAPPQAAALSADEKKLLDEREAVRKEAQAKKLAGDKPGMKAAFGRSDELRAELKKCGIEVEDKPDGSTSWRRVK